MCSNVARVLAVGCALAALLAPATASAYIDPGTAGLIVGGGGGIILWLLTALAFVRWRAKRMAAFLRAHPKIAVSLALVLGGSAAGGVGYWATATQAPPGGVVITQDAFKRVMLLGLDGTDPDVLRTLMDAGLMNNLKGVAQAGSFSPFQVPNPAESPVVWASLATGVNPGRHGVFDFIGRDPQRYLPSLALHSRTGDGFRFPIRAPAFWDVTTAHNVPTTLIRWPMTFPPPHVHGHALGGLGVPDVRGGLGSYTFFTDVAPAAGEDGAERVTVVHVNDGKVETVLAGPRARELVGTKVLEAPVTVKVGKDGTSAVITVGGTTYAVEEGGWTGFVEVTFAGPLFTQHLGLVRFHLVSGSKPFALYATSVEMHPEAPLVPFTWPADYGAELHKALGPYHTLGMPEDTKALGDGRISQRAFLEMCQEVERERRAMLMYELNRFESGVLAFVFDTPDRIQHMTPATDDVANSPIGRYYIEFDRFLGTVLKKLPPDTPLIIFSDHGFSTFKRSVDVNRWLAENGYLTVDQKAWDARPKGTWGELYRYVDWSKTRAYAVGFAGIYINVAGREGQGIVPAEQRHALSQQIAARLQQLQDPQTGKAVVHKAYVRDQIYDGKHADEAPDVVVGLTEGYRGSWQSAVGGITGEVLSDNTKPWQRDHIVDASFVAGSLVTNFPVRVPQPHAYDLAPTVLSLLGLPVPQDMQGRPLQAEPPVAAR